METFAAIRSRRSVRKYRSRPIARAQLTRILEAGRWAPSGLNNQPWRFLVLTPARRKGLAVFTKYASLLRGCAAGIAVFLDTRRSYNRKKDLMAMGACLQNMLLCAHDAGLGACWLGEILNKGREAERYLRVHPDLELCAVLTIGYPAESVRSSRKRLPALLL